VPAVNVARAASAAARRSSQTTRGSTAMARPNLSQARTGRETGEAHSNDGVRRRRKTPAADRQRLLG